MATTLYWRTDTTEIRLSLSHQAETYTLVDDGVVPCLGAANRRLSETAGTAGSSSSLASGQATTSNPADPGLNVSYATAFSLPLASDVTLVMASSIISGDIWANETSMSANAALHIGIYAVHPNGTYDRLVGNWVPFNGTELGTSSAQMSFSVYSASTITLHAGDVIFAVLWINNPSGAVQASGYAVAIGADGAEGSSYDTQIRFSDTLTFASDPTGSVLNLRSESSDISGSGNKKLWSDSASNPATYTVSSVLYPSHAQWTDTAGGNPLAWFTPQLQAVTLEGYATISLRAKAAVGGYVSALIEIYKTNADGSNPVLIGRGKQGQAIGISEYQFINNRIPINGTLIDGQRLKVVIKTASGQVTQTAGQTVNIYVESATADTSIQFPATLVEYSSGPATIEASASFAASSGLSVTGTSERFATVSMSATSSMTAVGAILVSAATTMAATSTFSATGTHTAVATVTMTASSSLTLTATKTAIAAASYAAVSTFTAVGVATRFATVAYTAAAGFTATGATLITVTVTFAAVSGWAFGGAAPAVRGRGASTTQASGSYWDVSGYPVVSIPRSSFNVAPVAGDLLVAFVWWTGYSIDYFNPPGVNFYAPSGWTARNGTSFGGGLYGGAIYTKTAAGDTSDDCTWSFEILDGPGELGVRVFAISNPGTPSYVGPSFGIGTTASIGAVGAAGDLEIADFAELLDSVAPTLGYPLAPAGMTDEGLSSTGYMATRGASLAQSSTGTRSATTSPSGRWGAFAVAIASAAGGGGAVVEKFGTGTFAGSSSFTATGTSDHKATASFAATSSLTAVGEIAGGIVQATASFSTSSAFTAIGTVTAIAAVTLAATSAFSATGVVSRIAAVTYGATSSFSATGLVTKIASVTMAATSTFTAVSFVFRPAIVTFAGSSALTIQAFREIFAAITMAASSTLSLTGLVTFFATATFTALADFTALATPYRLGVLKPNILYGVSGLTGTYTDIDDSPDTPDANALVPTGGAIDVRIGFEDHGYQMRLLAGDQILRVVVKVP